MIIAYTNTQFENAKSQDKLPLKCEICSKIFYRTKSDIKRSILGTRSQIQTCSIKYKCKKQHKNGSTKVKCAQCNKVFYKTNSRIKEHHKNFCSQSCSATYHNCNKTYGNRVSKLELYIKKELQQLFPTLCIEYNNKTAINSELDIYIPVLNIAFELNGIYHFKPIHGYKKLQQIQHNDDLKIAKCNNSNIQLYVIDTSSQIHFTPKSSKKFLDFIANTIHSKL